MSFRVSTPGVFLCLSFVVTVLVLSVEYRVRIYQWGDLTLDLQIPQWIPYVAIPVSPLDAGPHRRPSGDHLRAVAQSGAGQGIVLVSTARSETCIPRAFGLQT